MHLKEQRTKARHRVGIQTHHLLIPRRVLDHCATYNHWPNSYHEYLRPDVEVIRKNAKTLSIQSIHPTLTHTKVKQISLTIIFHL